MQVGQLHRPAARQHRQRRPPQAAAAQEQGILGRGRQRRSVVHRRPATVGEAQAGVELVAQRRQLAQYLPPPPRERLGLLVELVEPPQQLVALDLDLHPTEAGDPGGHAHERQVDVVRTATPDTDGHPGLPRTSVTQGPGTGRRGPVAPCAGRPIIVPPPADNDPRRRVPRRAPAHPRTPPPNPPSPPPQRCGNSLAPNRRRIGANEIRRSAGRRESGRRGAGRGAGAGPGLRARWRRGRTRPRRGSRARGTPRPPRPASRPRPRLRRPRRTPARARAVPWGWSRGAVRTWA